MLPLSGLSRELRQRRRVVLPEPLEPRMTTTSPLSIEKEMPFAGVLLKKNEDLDTLTRSKQQPQRRW